MAKNIATPNASNILGTTSKFFRLMENEGITLKDFQYIIDNKSARSKLANFLRSISLKEAYDILAEEQIKILIADYYLKIFDLDIKSKILKMQFPRKEGLNVFMLAGHPALHKQEDKITDAFVKKWGIGVLKDLSPVADKVNRHFEQSRPKSLYLFIHHGGDRPDIRYQGRHYEHMRNIGTMFLNAEEYLLCTGFHRFTKDYFMDKNWCTKTSSRWYGDDTVDIGWNSVGNRIDLVRGNRDDFLDGSGVREIFFSLP